MSRPPTPGELGIIKIIDATEELVHQWQAGNSAGILVAYVEGVGLQVERAVGHLRAEGDEADDGEGDEAA